MERGTFLLYTNSIVETQKESEDSSPGGSRILPEKKESLFEAQFREFVIPSIDFRVLPLTESLGLFMGEILDVPDRGLFPGMHPQLVVDSAIPDREASITLRLNHIPATEALRHVTAPARCRIEDETIIVEPLRRE